MLRDQGTDTTEIEECNEWGVDTTHAYSEWQDVDRELRSIARRQSGLDAELMRALREAERVRLWRHLGCASMMEYLERVFGYSPRVAQERLRTARKLEELPDLAAALEEHELPFSAVRELSRVATPQTQRTWRAAARGKSLREIEEMVSGLAEGDLPGSRKKPELMRVRMSYEHVDTTTQALERQVRQMLDAERGERLDDNAFLAAVFQLALGTRSGHESTIDKARFQIVHYQCDACGDAAQLGGGARLAVDGAALERAHCDAEHVTLDAPGKPTQDVPKRVRRFVELRDGKCCRVPGCRASRFLEVHHIVHREDGGTHDPMNLIVLCDGHHKAHHDGTLWIGGTAAALVVQRPGDNLPDAHVGAASSPPSTVTVQNVPTHRRAPDHAPAPIHAPTGPKAPSDRSQRSRFDIVELKINAVSALKNLRFKAAIAKDAVDAALDEIGADATLEQVVRRALQLCR